MINYSIRFLLIEPDFSYGVLHRNYVEITKVLMAESLRDAWITIGEEYLYGKPSFHVASMLQAWERNDERWTPISIPTEYQSDISAVIAVDNYEKDNVRKLIDNKLDEINFNWALRKTGEGG